MSALYQRQLARGGIVDSSEQDCVIDETWVSEGVLVLVPVLSQE